MCTYPYSELLSLDEVPRKHKTAALCRAHRKVAREAAAVYYLETIFQIRDKGCYLPRLIHMHAINMNKPQFIDKNSSWAEV
jgi:hypothetical protein